MPFQHILSRFDSESLIDRFSSIGNSILLYTIWRLAINLEKSKFPKRATDDFSWNVHLSFYDLEKKKKSSLPITEISQYLTTYESLLLIGATDEVEFSFIEYIEKSDSTDEFLNIKIWKDDIRKETYDTMPLWEAGRDNADIICYISASYKLNLWITKTLIDSSILKWKDNKTTDPKIDFWTSKKQLEIVWWVLINGFETFWERKFEVKKKELPNNANIDLFSTLLYLSNNHYIKLYEYWRITYWANKIPTEFFIEILDTKGLKELLWIDQPISNPRKMENTEILQFLEKIENCKRLLSEWVLETRKEQDLIVEIRQFQYEKISDNEIFLLKVKKLKAHPQTIWSSHSSRWFSGSISPYILEWENLFVEYLWRGDLKEIANEVEIVKIDIKLWDTMNEVVFDSSTWRVWQNWIKICELTIGKAPYKFFKYLYENKWRVLNYDELKNEVNSWKMNTTSAKYCQKLKNWLDERIKKYIKPNGIWFIFDLE